MKRKIQVFDYAGEIMKKLSTGILLTAKAEGKVNPMTIAWGTLGIEWAKPIFIAFVRENRFTKGLLEKNPEFTISVPLKEDGKKILGYCGAKSGRDTDKIADLGLTLEEPEQISVPGIKELPLTLECRVLYVQKQEAKAIHPEDREKFYPQTVDSSFPRANRDYHTAFYGHIVSAYVIE